MHRSRSQIWIAVCLTLGLLLAACAGETPTAGVTTLPPTGSAVQSILPTPTVQSVVQSILPTPTSLPTATPTAVPSPIPLAADVQLVVLHTNDTWGETEPCG